MSINDHRGFIRQGILIILPAILLSIAGIYALKKDRVLAEHEAVEQARQVARELAQDVLLQATTVALPTSSKIPNTEGSGVQSDPLLQVRNGDTNIVAVQVDARNSLVHPPQLLESTFGHWLDETRLSPEQSSAWVEFSQGIWNAGALEVVQSNLVHLLSTQPPDEFAGVAQYQVAIRALQAGELGVAEQGLRLVGTRYAHVRGETGLPLKMLADLQLLQWGEGADSVMQVESVLASLLEQPTAVAMQIVSQLEGMALKKAGSPDVRDLHLEQSLERWRDAFQLHQEARDFHRALIQFLDRKGEGSLDSAQAFWILWGGQSWWVSSKAAREGRWWIAQTEPRVAESIRRALAQHSIPAWFSVEVNLGEKVLYPSHSDQRVLSVYPETSEKQLEPSQFQIKVILSDPSALYQRQRWRSFLFVALILVSLAAVVVGFIHARRAFLKQRRLNELKTNFVSSVSHELRAPIASMRLMAEELQDTGPESPSKAAEYHRFIVQECQRLSALIENVLDFARLEQGRKKYEMEPCNLVSLVGHTVSTLRLVAEEKQQRLELTLPPECIEVEVDSSAIQQVIINLLDNAMKYGPPNSSVRIALQLRQDRNPAIAVLSVGDQGPGIPLEEQERIFQRFYRCGTELRRETRGVGLGLSIARSIVEAHKGTLRVESRPGDGSCFIVELPLADQQHENRA